MGSWSRVLLMGVWFALILPAAGCSVDVIAPVNAWLILTKESMGCLEGQSLRADLKQQFAGKVVQAAQVEEIKNPEDSTNRNELILSFPAQPIGGLAGYYLVKLSCHSSRPQKALLLVGPTYLQKKNNRWQMVSQVKSDGWVAVQMLYSRNPELLKGWYSYPENGVAPRPVDFFNGYPIQGEFKGVTQVLSLKRWSRISFDFDATVIAETWEVDCCQGLLQKLCRTLATRQNDFIWNHKVVTRESLAQAIATFTPHRRFQLLLRHDDGAQMAMDRDDFVPQLRQKVALENQDQTLSGAEVWLRVD